MGDKPEELLPLLEFEEERGIDMGGCNVCGDSDCDGDDKGGRAEEEDCDCDCDWDGGDCSGRPH